MLKINDKIIILILSLMILIFIIIIKYKNYKYNIQKIEPFQNKLEDVEDVCEARKKLGIEPCISVTKGDIGKTGDKGDEGIVGPLGPIGPVGLTGLDGKNGKSIGPLEYWNEDGTIKLGEYKPADMSHIPVTNIYIPNGNRGEKGEIGVIGPIGPVGESGAVGLPGVCYKGDIGEKGERGDIGGIADDIMINTINKEKDDNGNSKNLEIWGNEFKIKSAKMELEDAKLIMGNDINFNYSHGAQGGGIYWKDAQGDDLASLYYGSANTLNVENDNGININNNIFLDKNEEDSESQDASIKSKFYNILNGDKNGLNIKPYNSKLYIDGDFETTGDIKSGGEFTANKFKSTSLESGNIISKGDITSDGDIKGKNINGTTITSDGDIKGKTITSDGDVNANKLVLSSPSKGNNNLCFGNICYDNDDFVKFGNKPPKIFRKLGNNIYSDASELHVGNQSLGDAKLYIAGGDNKKATIFLGEERRNLGKYGFSIEYDGDPNILRIYTHNNSIDGTKVFQINRNTGDTDIGGNLSVHGKIRHMGFQDWRNYQYW
tara:strand:+ start:2392 stop:4032 length:1641 start_codon:yes stop_codon:yes gene_type:complete